MASLTRTQVNSMEPWTGMLTGPVIFLVNLQVNFTMSSWVCATSNYWAIHLAHIISLAITAFSGWMAWRTWHRSDDEPVPSEGHSLLSRDQFLGFLGVLTASFFTFVLVAHWIPNVLLDPCR